MFLGTSVVPISSHSHVCQQEIRYDYAQTSIYLFLNVTNQIWLGEQAELQPGKQNMLVCDS